MKRALLVGNGFTSNLINTFKNEPMMNKIYEKMPITVNKIEDKFNVFRDTDLSNNDIYSVTEALFCGDNLYCGNNVFPNDDGIHFQESIKSLIVQKLEEIGFGEPQKTFKDYFKDYGLIFLINSNRILGVETYLKIIHMFMAIGYFSEEDYKSMKSTANEVYFNAGKHGVDSINNADIDVSKLIQEISKFTDVFTTNYDTVLDDILERTERFPYHLHGGFSINHLNKNPDGRYLPNEAKLIWGISAESKYNELRVGFDWSDLSWSAFRWGDSQISDYFNYLQEREYEEIHILGFSGENDNHINQKIKLNINIRRVIVYVHPSKVNDVETKVKSRILFGNNNKYDVIVRSWDDFWNKIKVTY